MKRDMNKIIENVKVFDKYAMTPTELNNLINENPPEEAIIKAFMFGYAQGKKAVQIKE